MRRFTVLVVMTVLCILIITPCVSYAGSINANEQRVISEASGTFEYEGKTYRVSPGYISQLSNKLSQDGIDLTSSQASQAIATMYANVAEGVSRGYLYQVGGSSDGTDETDNGNSNENYDSDSGDSESNNGTSDDGSNSNEKTDSDNKASSNDEINSDKKINKEFSPLPVIKDTGFNVNIAFLGIAIILLVLISIGFINKKHKAFKYAVPLGFALVVASVSFLIVGPFEDLFSAQLTTAAVQGSPTSSVDIDTEDFTYPSAGSKYGQIYSENLGLKAPLYYGDTNAIFEKGAGQYTGSSIPGEGKSIIVGGHDLSFFAPLKTAKKGDLISVTTTYGDYEYEVTSTKVADYNDESAYVRSSGEELILYTCYPFGLILGDRPERFFVYAQKVSGPDITSDVKEAMYE